MNNSKVQNKRENLEYEIAFTRAYKAAKKMYSHPAQIELACVKAQYPAIMHEIQDEDLFAGRLEFSAVGWGIQHQTGGFGFFIDEPRVIAALEKQPGSGAYREGLHDMLVFWRTECTNNKVMRDMPEKIREAIISDDWEKQSLPATPILRMCGSYLDFDKLVKLGIPGLIAEMESHLEREKSNGGDTVLFECMVGALEQLKTVCLFFRDQALAKAEKETSAERKRQLTVMADVLEKNTERAPATMREAIQLVWLYGMMTPQAEYGRMDVYLGDLYARDIDNGIITEQEALALIQSFYVLIDHLDCEVNGRVLVGGEGRRNPENADRFCLVAIEACRTVREVLPQFTLRFNKHTPKEVWDASMRCIEEGRSFPLLYNDDEIIPCIMNAFRVDRARAASYILQGCGEIAFDHYSFGTPSGSLNMLKILEIVINGGYDPVGERWIGPKTKPLSECSSFDEFYDIYKKHLDYYVKAEAAFEMYEYQKTGELHAFMFVTMLYDGCCERGKAMFDGGCASLNGTLELYGMINAADSLTAIKKLVFEERRLTGAQMTDILLANFFDHDEERKMMMDCPKYGNDDPYADDTLLDLQGYVSKKIRDSAKGAGLDSYLQVTINNAQNTTLARWVGASADGRKAGTPTANANNPAPGADKNGITAMLNSILKVPHDNNAGTVQNLRLSRELFQNSREKVYDLIDNYFGRGGVHLMVTVVGKDDLRKALETPELYRDLIVRVGGFSARFVDLPKDVQSEIYERVTY